MIATTTTTNTPGAVIILWLVTHRPRYGHVRA
jgi:hypothetical protein